ncbi:helix-turn-helix domain-containing protein [Streptomyces sp. NPDC056773]|uniref:helix-turn-helix domain-containing protein n=1 Tax=unclassified Streptomyces TaxID=2593676 RepID=UPI0036B3DCF3
MLSAELLARDDLRLALVEHDFAAAFRLIKKYGGLSQNRIASACQLTPGKVSTITSGSQKVVSFDVIARIADGLGIPGHFVGLAARPWEGRPSPPPEPVHNSPVVDDLPWHPEVTAALAAQLTGTDLAMDRRTAARLIATAALTGTALLDPLEGWLAEPARADERRPPGRLGTHDVAQLEQTAVAFRRWDHQFGGGLRSKAVLGQLNDTAAALEEHQSHEVEKRLYRVMAQLSGTAATMSWDSGHQRRAQDYYRLALRAAHAGGDIPFGANVLAGMARQMLYTDRPTDALELIRLAQDGSRSMSGPRVRAMLHTREAWAYAAMGRVAAFRRATGQAEEALGAAGPQKDEPHWISYFDQAELAGVTGGRLLDLARADPRSHAETAAEHIRTALNSRGTEASRSHALDRIGLAESRFLAGDLSEAVTESQQAVLAASLTQSSRVRTQLGALYQYTVGRSESRAVREVRDSIRELLAN